jgi:hypothetical protein
VYVVAFYVLRKSAFVGKKKSFELIKMHGKTTIKTIKISSNITTQQISLPLYA